MPEDPQKPLSQTPASPTTQPEPEDELAHYDDAVIGKAFRWSAIAFVFIGLIGAGTFLVLKRKPAPPPPKVTALSAPVLRTNLTQQMPDAKFSDITDSAGIRFVQQNGAYGDKLLPETMGSGVAFFDYDNDGLPDLLFVNGTTWPWKDKPSSPATMALYHNDGGGHFTDATQGSGLDVSFYGMGVAAGDFDNDGLVDLLVTAVGPNHLFKNLGQGKFRDITAEAGVAGAPTEWSTSAAWIDYDRDGKLDLFICNYVRWSREIDFEVGYKLVGVGRAYGQPMNFSGTFPCLYHNDGNGRFTDVSASSGIQIKNTATGVPLAKSLGVAPIDLDQDGWIDLVVANDTVQNFVFLNQRDGTFKEVGAISGIAFDSYGMARGAMGIDAAYYRNDSHLGIGVGNFANEMTALYVSQGKPFPFTDEAIAEGGGPASRLLLKFGLFFFDYDLDGRLDLLTANGHLEEEISKIQQSQKYAQPAQLFWNAGPESASCFMPVPSAKAGTDLFKPIVGRGSAFADLDGDGDLDVVLTQVAGRPLLLRNDQDLHHHWVRLKLVGQKSNRDAIGATVKIRRGAETFTRQVMPARSYLSQSELPVTFGLGSSTAIDAIEIVWPNGGTQTIDPSRVKLDATSTIAEE